MKQCSGWTCFDTLLIARSAIHLNSYSQHFAITSQKTHYLFQKTFICDVIVRCVWRCVIPRDSNVACANKRVSFQFHKTFHWSLTDLIEVQLSRTSLEFKIAETEWLRSESFKPVTADLRHHLEKSGTKALELWVTNKSHHFLLKIWNLFTRFKTVGVGKG